MYEEGKVSGPEQTGDVPSILRQLDQLLDSAGVPGELRSQVAESVMTYDVSDKTCTAVGESLALSDNARVILEQRYLRKDADDNPIETPEGLFRRVARSIAEGEDAGMRAEWENRFYDLLTSLKFLPNSPTLVNAGTGKGCLSACFVVTPDDNMESIMNVAHDAAMIEKWGGGIGFGFSKLRPRNDVIRTTHGHACGPIAVMKLYSSVGATLTQGAFRLGAHMGQLRDSHPDVREFIHCKDNDDTLQNFNISVQITDEFMKAVRDDADWQLINPRDEGAGPSGDVVETIRARDLWNEISESAWKTGDPGVVFMDRVWETAPNPQMGRIETSNPCVTGDTLVYTGDGLIPISELVGETPTLSLDSRSGVESSFATKVWQSGVKPVFRLSTREGYTLKLTADHEVFTTRGKVAAGDLSKGDQIRLVDHKGGFGNLGDRNLGLVLGWLTGDGHIDVKRAVLSFYGEDHEIGPLVAEATQNVVAGTGQRPTRAYPTDMHVTGAGRGMVQSTRLRDVVRGYGLTEQDRRHVPEVVYQGTEEMQRAYLQTLFGADGTVSGKGPNKGLSVRLNSSYRELPEGVQRLLLNFGIASRIYLHRKERMASMPDGKGGMKEYRTASNYEMVVSKDNVRRFMDEVGFLNERKNAQLQDVAGQYKKGFYKERFLATFERLDPMGEEPVYDLTEPMTHSFVANGLCVSNCGEEFLENYGNCCLGSINLDVHVRDGVIDWDSLEETVRTSVRFLDDVINVNSFPLDKLREVNLATRRIGLGVMGWADALVRMNVPYDSPEALEAANEVGGFIKRIAWDESANLAKERGPFPEYERSALKERGLPPVRNSSVITIAPTGTISRIAGCSSGIEPHFALAWWSNVLWKDHEGSSSRLLDAPASTMESLKRELGDDKRVREVLEQIIENPEGAESTLREYGLNPAVYRTAMSISPESHVRMQGAWQDHVTNSVSKTINLPNSATVDDVRRAYELAWETGCKAVTVYRDGSKSMQVLETTSEASEDDEVTVEQPRLLMPRERPTSVAGVTDLVRTGHGNMYVNITFDEDGKPFEVFTTLGKAGGCDSANLEAVSRLVSLALRSGIDPDAITHHLQGITCCPAWDGGTLIRSAPDAMAHALSNHLHASHTAIPGPSEEQSTVVQPSLFPSKGRSNGHANGSTANGQPRSPSAVRCPKCSGNLIPQEGCLNCLDCGYSKCE